MAKELHVPSSAVRWHLLAVIFVIGALVYIFLDVRLSVNPRILKHLRTFKGHYSKGGVTTSGKPAITPSTSKQTKMTTSSKYVYGTSTRPNPKKPKTALEEKIEIIKDRVLENKYKVILMDLLKKFLKVAEDLKLVYILYGGSLIGSWRHHGMVPWDDDIDVLVNISQKGALLKKIEQSKPHYFVVNGNPIIKFYSEKSPEEIQGASHKWPFIDICFFEENSKEIWDMVNVFRKYKLPKNMVFPLHKRPFEGFEVDAPRDSLGVINIQYHWIKPHMCSTWNYDHRREKSGLERTEVPCKVLKDNFPFVYRKYVNDTMIETLKIGEKVIHTKFVREPKSSAIPPY